MVFNVFSEIWVMYYFPFNNDLQDITIGIINRDQGELLLIPKF